MPRYEDLARKVVLITGGAHGIGHAAVRAFHAQDATVHFCDLDAHAGGSLAAELGERACFHPVNLTSEAEIESWVAGVRARSPQIHVLVNNAARDPRIPLPGLTATAWDDLFAVNLRPAVLLARELAPLMTNGGSIINLASITFHTGPESMSAYVATKGGLIGLTRALARELGPQRIRVNTLSPGWVMTGRQLRDYVDDDICAMLRRVQCIPDLLEPADIAEVMLFLASDASRAITGQELLADRGWAHH